jgi:hypothetical protein
VREKGSTGRIKAVSIFAQDERSNLNELTKRQELIKT